MRPETSQPAQLPFILVVIRFLLALSGSKRGIIYYFGGAVPQGRKVEPEQVQQLRRNFMALNALIISVCWSAFILSPDMWISLAAFMGQGVCTWWLIRQRSNGLGKNSLAKQPVGDELRVVLERLTQDFPVVNGYVAANRLLVEFTIFELELLREWTDCEKRRLQASINT